MNWLKAVLVSYALFLGFAGVQAYVNKGSTMSLYGGVGAAVAVVAAIALMSWKPAAGYILAFLVAGAMIYRFLKEFLKADDPTQAIWPHLTITIVSALVAVALVIGQFMAKENLAKGEDRHGA